MKKSNYLDRIPSRLQEKWNVGDDGIVEIVVENKGFYNCIAQKLFKKPRFSFIKLDTYGSCVWQEIDGKKTVYEIGQLLEQEHRGASDKLYERLTTFFGILERNGYIGFNKEDKK